MAAVTTPAASNIKQVALTCLAITVSVLPSGITQAWGLYGGLAAPLAISEIKRGSGDYKKIPSKGVYGLSAGDRVRCRVSGGVGYGDPLQRDPIQVREDVVDRKITMGTAPNGYGVIFRNDLEIDDAATDVQRAALAAARGRVSWTFDRGDLGVQ